MSLQTLINAEIEAQGPMTFARFCELALYHPELGYYGAGRLIGRAGDFYTNVSVGPLFGRLLAGQFEELWREMGSPAEFWVVEQGAHDGQLAADILGAMEEPFRTACQYVIIEPLPALRARQIQNVPAGTVRWFDDLTALPEFDGVHFSNELVDALPFHLVRSTGPGWEEMRVASESGDLILRPGPLLPELTEEAGQLPERPAGYLTELRPAAREWIREVAARLRCGLVLVVDYGFPRERLLAPHRTEGTFSCYSEHRRDARPLEGPGSKDITAHVDFTALTQAGEAAGLHLAGFTDQHHFLVGAAERLLRSLEGQAVEPAARKTLRGLQTLLHPESMGTQFHYLALTKNLPEPLGISGFNYAREAGAALRGDGLREVRPPQ